MSYFQCSKALFYTCQSRSAFLLRLGESYCRKTGPAMLIISMDQDMELWDESQSQWVKTKSVLFPVGVPFDFKTNRARVAICFLDDLGRDFAFLHPQMKRKLKINTNDICYCDIRYEDQIRVDARHVIEHRPEAEVVIRKLNSWARRFEMLGKQDGIVFDVDPRAAKAVEYVKANCTVNISVGEVAKHVNLSVPRLTQLFKQATGTSLRRFRLWQRIFYAARQLESGVSLTDAALSAGFTDYAQCFRVYKELGGYHPSKTKKLTEVKVAAGF